MAAQYQDDKKRFQRFLDPAATGRFGKQEEVRTSPLFTLAVKYAVDPHHADSVPSDSSDDSDEEYSSEEEVLPGYALLGFHTGHDPEVGDKEPIFMNVNAPNSAFICGSQGSGKSYTLACMLENCLVNDEKFGKMVFPVAGVVFHYDVDSAGSIAEAAYLCSRGVPVNVFVSPSNEHFLRTAYGRLQGKGGPGAAVTVRAFRIFGCDLSIERIHKLMAFSEKDGHVPLYMEVAQRILRQMAMEGAGSTSFDYRKFRKMLLDEPLSRDQVAMLRLRLDLLESFLDLTTPPREIARIRTATLRPGSLTIIDMSDPFLDAATVCVLFEVYMSIAKEYRPRSGLVVALDEAHKFMNKSAAAQNFTERLLTTIREQRHNATRVYIATQEPTISEKLLDLCSVAIVHRFSSPAWFVALKGHLGGVTSASAADEVAMFDRIVDLQVGESLVFAPTAYLKVGPKGVTKKAGAVPVKMKTRMRLGIDGGASLLANAGAAS